MSTTTPQQSINNRLKIAWIVAPNHEVQDPVRYTYSELLLVYNQNTVDLYSGMSVTFIFRHFPTDPARFLFISHHILRNSWIVNLRHMRMSELQHEKNILC